MIRATPSGLAGPLLVAVAAFLWGTDSVFRYPIADAADPTVLVFAEHVLGVAALLVWVVALQRRRLFELTAKEWLSAVFVGAGGSAIATTIFTLSFRYVNPSVAVLLQKLQPIVVVVVSFAVLGERPRGRFYLWAALALVAGVLLSFPDFNFDLSGGDAHSKGVLLALIASVIWGLSTVFGKVLLVRAPASVATFWRYLFGLATLAVMLLFPHEAVKWDVVSRRQFVWPVIYLSFAAGIIPMATYYAGLSRTRASVATFVELLFPVSSVVLNTVILKMPLSAMQLGSGALLLFAVTMISLGV